MKSSVVERSSLEDSFWKGLQEIAQRHEETLSDRQFANLSSAIRLLSGSELDQLGPSKYSVEHRRCWRRILDRLLANRR